MLELADGCRPPAENGWFAFVRKGAAVDVHDNAAGLFGDEFAGSEVPGGKAQFRIQSEPAACGPAAVQSG